MKVADTLNRQMLGQMFPGNPRFVRAMEDQAKAVDTATEGVTTTAQATEAMKDASVIVLAPNGAFEGERVLVLGQGLVGIDDGSTLTIQASSRIPLVEGDFSLSFALAGNSVVGLPLVGMLATTENAEVLANKTLKTPKISSIGDYVDDAAAAAGGVPVGGVYRNGSALMIRVA